MQPILENCWRAVPVVVLVLVLMARKLFKLRKQRDRARAGFRLVREQLQDLLRCPNCSRHRQENPRPLERLVMRIGAPRYLRRWWMRSRLIDDARPRGGFAMHELYVPWWAIPLDWIWQRIFGVPKIQLASAPSVSPGSYAAAVRVMVLLADAARLNTGCQNDPFTGVTVERVNAVITQHTCR